LCGRLKGHGVSEILGTISVERDIEGRDAASIREYLEDTGWGEEDIQQEIRRWATEAQPFGEVPRKDERLSITDDGGVRRQISELEVYEVARAQGLPDETPIDHPAVYRTDICDVRSTNAKFLALSWGIVQYLLNEIDIRDKQIEELK
jgi:hypothetical protein